MNAHERLESRLKVLDLRIETVGAHVDEERIALIAGGDDPNSTEAAHLAGCDECTDLLMTLGAGLERLVAEGSPASTLLAPPAPPVRPVRRRRPLVVAGLLLAAAGALAAGGTWLARAPAEDPPLEEAPAAPPPVRSARPAPPPEPEVSAGVVLPEVASDEGPPEAPTSAPPAPADVAAPSSAAPHARAPRPATDEAVDLSLPGRAQHPLERQFVDGQPRGYGYLQLNSKPASEVFVDGRHLGSTPILDERLPEGPHDVVLRYARPEAAEPEQHFRVVIERDQTWRATRRNLKPGIH